MRAGETVPSAQPEATRQGEGEGGRGVGRYEGRNMGNGKARQAKSELVVAPWPPASPLGGQERALPETGFATPRFWQPLKREAARTWAACGAFEWWALGYLGVSSLLVLVFAENLA